MCHLAALLGSCEMVQALLDYDADIQAKSQSATGLPEEVARGMTALHFATFAGNLEIVELLIKNGVEISAKDQLGRCALELAFCVGRERVALALMAHGADAKITVADGKVVRATELKERLEEIVDELDNGQSNRLKM